MKTMSKNLPVTGTLLGVLALFSAVVMVPRPLLGAEPVEWQAVSQQELEQERARGVADDFKMKAKMNNSSVDANGTVASNAIDNGAFDSASGIVNVIQNNGNNAIIQNGVVVNVNVFQGTP